LFLHRFLLLLSYYYYEHMSKSLTSLISETAKGISTRLSKYKNIWYYMAPKRWISIRNIVIYLETKFPLNRRIFVFWRPFLVQNGHHSKPKIVFAPFLIIIMNICQKLWPHLYRKLPKGFPQDLAYILNRVGRIFWPKKNCRRQNQQNFNVLWFQWKLTSILIFYQPYLIYMPSLVEIPLAVFDISEVKVFDICS
jgi:hypothetical protein